MFKIGDLVKSLRGIYQGFGIILDIRRDEDGIFNENVYLVKWIECSENAKIEYDDTIEKIS